MAWKLVSIDMTALQHKSLDVRIQLMNENGNLFATAIKLDQEKLLNTTLAEIQESAIIEMKKSTC